MEDEKQPEKRKKPATAEEWQEQQREDHEKYVKEHGSEVKEEKEPDKGEE